MMLTELVSAADRVGATSSRLAKIDALAELLSRADPTEIPAVMGLLLAAPRQGRLGSGGVASPPSTSPTPTARR